MAETICDIATPSYRLGLGEVIDASVGSRWLDCLETVAEANGESEEIRTVALYGHLLALDRYFEPDDRATAEAVAGLEAIATPGGPFSLTLRADAITDLAVDVAESFVRTETLGPFERFVSALATMLAPARWATIDGRIVTRTVELERDGEISIDVLAAVDDSLETLD
ncbi:MAG: hypothetical protein ABEJ86_00605 [Halococcoides sp.]